MAAAPPREMLAHSRIPQLSKSGLLHKPLNGVGPERENPCLVSGSGCTRNADVLCSVGA